MGVTKPETWELCRLTVGDQVRLAIATGRAARFNRDATVEHHIAVVEARWMAIESLIWQEIARMQKVEAGEDPASALLAALLTANTALEQARDQFSYYVGTHRAKGTAESEEKAVRNEEFVAICVNALASIAGVMEAHGG